MKSLKWYIGCFITIVAIFMHLSMRLVFADGEDLIVPKRNVLGIVDTPPAAGAGEYIETKSFSSGLGSFQIQTYRDMIGNVEEIQFLFTITDGTGNVNDEIRIYFDVDHSHTVSTTPDRGLRIFRQLTGGATNKVRKTNVNLFGPPIENGDLPDAQWEIQDNVGNWLVEVKIKSVDLNLNFIPSLMGMHIKAIDTPNAGPALNGNYPTTVNVSAIADWANLKTRKPLQYVLLLDESGSMKRDFAGDHPPVTTERWKAAKKASDIFAQLYHAFRPKLNAALVPYFNDKIGLATYYWDDGDAVDPDKSQSVYSLQLSKDITVDGYVDNNGTPPPDPVFGQHTPIKKGLDTAFGMLGTGAVDAVERVVILMSDGIHDRPSDNYDAEGYNFPPNFGSGNFQVNTVALGPDGSVGTQLLNDIRSFFSGFGGSYIGTLQEQALINAFAENLFSHYYINRVDINRMGVTTGQFPVNNNEPRLLVMLVWNSAGGVDRHFWLKKPNGTFVRYDMLPATGVTHHHYRDATLNYEIEYYLIEFPDSGTWQTVQTDGTTPEVADNSFALFDPTIYAFFTVVQDGDDFILRAVLKEEGVPITEPGAAVMVDVTKPDEGLGTYASTAQPNCTFAPPILPREFDPRFTRFESMVIDTPKVNPEPLPPHFAKVQALFAKCGKSGLDRSQGSLRLYDDGTHGDEATGDGIFTLRYTDTGKEGTYTFNFAASGNAPSGSAFSRIKTLSIHKSVNVAPPNTDFNFVNRFRQGNFQTIEVYVTPKDRHGEYLGPGHQPQIEFKTTAGQFISPIRDYNNGIYSQILRYDESKDRPVVTAVVQGKPLAPIRVFKPFELVLPFVGRFFFDDSLGLEDGTVVGARWGYRLTNQLTLEVEGGVTFTKTVAGNSGNVIQALANLRYDIYPLRIGKWIPYVTGGAGYVFFKGFGADDETFAFHGGAGSTFQRSNSFGVRIDGRVFRFNEVLGAGKTTNIQATGGLVFWF